MKIYTDEQRKRKQILSGIRYWKKELRNPKGKYSDFWCYREIEKLEKELKEEE